MAGHGWGCDQPQFHFTDRHMPQLSATEDLRTYSRYLAGGQAAGLIEVRVVTGPSVASLVYICKRLKLPTFTFYGWIITPVETGTWTWLIVSNEHGMSGIREAIVTGTLIESGQLTLEAYESSWAQDPNDPAYEGVDRETLRHISDAEEYDEQFPDHALSKTRRELKRLLTIELPLGEDA